MRDDGRSRAVPGRRGGGWVSERVWGRGTPRTGGGGRARGRGPGVG